MSANTGINNIISLYKKQENLELEVRFGKISRELFESIYNAVSAKFPPGTIEQSINTISKDIDLYSRDTNEQYIRKQTFIGKEKKADVYIQKTRVTKSIRSSTNSTEWTLNLSQELILNNTIKMNNSSIVRFKNRVSFNYPAVPLWRLDLTAVKTSTLQNLGANIVTIKNKIFSLAPMDNFVDSLDHVLIDSYEFEIEYIGDKSMLRDSKDIISVIEDLFSVIDPKYYSEANYQEEIYYVAKHIVKNRSLLPMFKTNWQLKQLGKQVIALDKRTYHNIFPPIGYYLTHKVDGIRCIISIHNTICRILADKLIEVNKSNEVSMKTTIVDAELVYSASEFKLYIFDVMIIDGENIAERGYSTRVTYLDEAVNIIARQMDVVCIRKPIIRIENDFKTAFDLITSTLYTADYATDGIILISPNQPYGDTNSYKWKPLEKTSIDFLAMKVPQELMGASQFVERANLDCYVLFCGIQPELQRKLGIEFLPGYKSIFSAQQIQNKDYYPIQFSPSIDPLAYIYYHSRENSVHGKVIELRKQKVIDGKSLDTAANESMLISGDWIFMRTREDRKLEKNYYGNNFKIAELTYGNYIDEFTMEELCNPRPIMLIASSGVYAAINSFQRFVPSMLIKKYFSGAQWIIDMPSGPGYDLHRYQEVGVHNVLFIDKDPATISELIQRKFDIIKRATGSFDNTIHTMLFDLKRPASELIKSVNHFGLYAEKIDGIICNYGLQYFCDDMKTLQNFIEAAELLLRHEGTLIITVLNGVAIFNKLVDGVEWSISENNVKKYSVKKQYIEDKLAPVGQLISVKAYDPNEQAQYIEEFLCNVDIVIQELEAREFIILDSARLSVELSNFKKANQKVYSTLSEADKQYLENFTYIIAKKS